MNEQNEELMQFFKTFVDVERLKLVGVLAVGQATIKELVERTGMTGTTVLRHLDQLCETGFIQQLNNPDGTEIFELQPRLLEEMAKRQFSLARELNPPPADQRNIPEDFTEDERKIITNYTYPTGELKQIPLQQKRQEILIRYVRHHVLNALESGKRYTEKEINVVIKPYYRDFTFFRRNFVDTGFLNRYADGSVYWLSEISEKTNAEANHA